MKNYYVGCLVIILVLLGVAPAFSSNILTNVQMTNISMTLKNMASEIITEAQVRGTAETNPSEVVNWTPDSYTLGTWLKNMTATSQYDPSTGMGSLGAIMEGIGPDPGLNSNGSLYQRTDSKLNFRLDVPTTGNYSVSLTADWTAQYQVTQQDVGFPVSFVSYHTWFGWSITNNFFGETEDLFLKGIGFGQFSQIPIENYDSKTINGSISYTKDLYFNAGVNWVGMALGSDQLVSTVASAPLPGAILLLGTGLGCLALYRRRRQIDKN